MHQFEDMLSSGLIVDVTPVICGVFLAVIGILAVTRKMLRNWLDKSCPATISVVGASSWMSNAGTGRRWQRRLAGRARSPAYRRVHRLCARICTVVAGTEGRTAELNPS